MRINKNSLYIQERKKGIQTNKNQVDAMLMQYAKGIYNYLIINPINNKYKNSIYFNFVQKKTKQSKKLNSLFFLSLALKKYFIHLLNYQKFLILIQNWFENQTNEYYQTLKKVNQLNNNTIKYYIKKKINLVNTLYNKYKFFYIKEFIFSIFLKNKEIKNQLENQIDFDFLRNKNLFFLLNKTRNLLYINNIIRKKNKEFITEYINLLKLIKKEYITIFFNQKKTNTKVISNLIYKILFNNTYREINMLANKYKMNSISQIKTFLDIKKENRYNIIEKKTNIKKNKENWLEVFMLVNTLKTKSYVKNVIFNVLKNMNPEYVQSQMILLQPNKKNLIEKTKTINKLNHVSEILTIKNNNNIKKIYNKEFYYILYHLKNSYVWYKNTVSICELEKNVLSNKKLNKKKTNKIMNRIINNANKKYGVTYSSILLNDQMYYWSNDYNPIKNKKYNHLVLINEIQKNTYKRQLTKFIHNLPFNELIKIKNIKIILNRVKKKIEEHANFNIINKDTRITLNIS